jgi:hypothetical protein
MPVGFIPGAFRSQNCSLDYIVENSGNIADRCHVVISEGMQASCLAHKEIKMNQKIQILTLALLTFSTIAVAAETSPKQAQKTDKESVCVVANDCAQTTHKSIAAIDKAVAAVDAARTSNDPKALHSALELAYKSLSEIKTDETKSERKMKALYTHLTKVEEHSARLKKDQDSLNDLLNGDQFVIN